MPNQTREETIDEFAFELNEFIEYQKSYGITEITYEDIESIAEGLKEKE